MAGIAGGVIFGALRRRSRWIWLLAAIVTVALAVGSVLVVRAVRHSDPPPPSQQQAVVPPVASSSSTSTASPTRTPVPTPTPDAAEAAVLQADRDALHAFIHASSIPDPTDPLLPQTMTGLELSTVKKNLIIHQADGVAGRGDIQILRAHVASLTATTAVVSQCNYGLLVSYRIATGAVIPTEDGGVPYYTAAKETFTLVDGVWKEANSEFHDGRDVSVCAGY